MEARDARVLRRDSRGACVAAWRQRRRTLLPDCQAAAARCPRRTDRIGRCRTDVTDRRRQKLELAALKNNFAAPLQSLPDLMFEPDLDGRCTIENALIVKHWGSVLGKLPQDSSVSFGSSPGLEVIAEGGETEEQLRFPAGIGCCHCQGFLFGRPLAADDFAATMPVGDSAA